ncbi:MAG: MOSC domain-containing protein [Planctomycetaceae bacterium]
MTTLDERLKQVPQVGRVEWIGLSPGSRAAIEIVDAAVAEVGIGLVGDHHSKSRAGGKRQVTLIQHEHLPAIAALANVSQASPDLLRRNIVVSGINLLSLKGLRFRIGAALLEGTGPCEPCSRMDENLGPGGFQAMRGHGGLTARVLEAGRIALGDAVAVEPASLSAEPTATTA